MKKKDGHVEAIEITTFRLSGYSCKEFIAANADIDDWLQQQAGFLSRRITELDNGTIADILIWEATENGTDAMHRIMTEMGHSRVHGMIDHSTVSWNCTPVLHRLDREL